jgi:hypothetical protein
MRARLSPTPLLALLCAFALSAAAHAPAASATGKLTLASPSLANLSSGRARIRDTLIHGDPLARAHTSQAPVSQPYGGAFTAPDGTQVEVFESPAYVPNPPALQNWANFFDSLPHGDELPKLTIYLAPQLEMQQLCGNPTAYSCYSGDKDIMVLLGDSPPPEVSLEDLAAHEYGHHIANSRLNDLGRAYEWGPEYWASAENICVRQDEGTAYPGDEGAHYTLNPGEAWAETYRLLAGGNSSLWEVVDPSFYPNARDLTLARRDVLTPYQGDEYIDHSGTFRRRHSRWHQEVLSVPNDGTVQIKLHSTGTLDADLYIYKSRSARKPLLHSAHSGHSEKLTETFCGYRHLDVAVYRFKGYGHYSIRITAPFNS